MESITHLNAYYDNNIIYRTDLVGDIGSVEFIPIYAADINRLELKKEVPVFDYKLPLPVTVYTKQTSGRRIYDRMFNNVSPAILLFGRVEYLVFHGTVYIVENGVVKILLSLVINWRHCKKIPNYGRGTDPTQFKLYIHEDLLFKKDHSVIYKKLLEILIKPIINDGISTLIVKDINSLIFKSSVIESQFSNIRELNNYLQSLNDLIYVE